MPNFKTDDNKKFYINILIGAAVAAAVTVAVMLIIAAVMAAFSIGEEYASPLSTVSLAAGGIIGARLAAIKNGKKGLLCGSLTALILFLVITVAGMFVNDKFSVMTFIHFIVSVLSCCIGGILGVNKTEKRKIV